MTKGNEMAEDPQRDAAGAMNRTINDMMDKPILPLPSETYVEGSAVWEDLDRQAEEQEATSLDPAEHEAPAEPIEGVSDAADLVSAESAAPEAMAADEVYAASFQSENGESGED